MGNGKYLLPQSRHPLIQADALIRAVLHQRRLGPQTETRLAVLAHHVQMRHDHAAHSLGPVVAALLDHRPHALVELVLHLRQGLLAHPQLVAVLHAKHIREELGHRLTADPQELRLSIVNQIQTVRSEAPRGQVDGRRENDLAGLLVWHAGIVGHVVKGVHLRVDVLDEKGERQGGQ